MVFTSLGHHVNQETLREAFRRTRKDGAVGVDGQTAADYAKDLEGNLQSLLERFKSGSYRAPSVRRVHIPKGCGTTTRPIGIPTFEDKVLQRAVVMVLEAVYEQDFLDCSYGFRRGRSQHGALETLWQGLMDYKGGWVLEVDVKSFFDDLNHQKLRAILDQRVRDGVLRRMIDKWLKAGILEEGNIQYPDSGTPQGGVVSPILANIYLHEVLDRWFETHVKPKLGGQAFLIRYADDFVIVFSLESDARRVFGLLPERFGEYGLTIHPEKTRLVPFCRPPLYATGKGGTPKSKGPGTFDLLGFTHFWGKSRKGKWVVKRKTASSRLRRSLTAIGDWCRRNRHRPVREQHHTLVLKVRGHYQYYGITGNSSALSTYLLQVTRSWRKWLDRRSQHSTMPWRRFTCLLQTYPLPPARCVHSVLRT